MQMLYQWLNYIAQVGGYVFDLINSEWLLGLVFGLHIIYLFIIAVKLKKNTD